MLRTNLQPKNHVRLMISLENSNWSRFVILLGLRGSLKMIKKLHIVRCNVFSTVDMKEIVIQPK